MQVPTTAVQAGAREVRTWLTKWCFQQLHLAEVPLPSEEGTTSKMLRSLTFYNRHKLVLAEVLGYMIYGLFRFTVEFLGVGV